MTQDADSGVWRGRTYFHEFKEDDVCVEYSAKVHPSMTEVDIWAAWRISTEEDVELSDSAMDKYTDFIAEHHLNWI